jgi:hypothetical protein
MAKIMSDAQMRLNGDFLMDIKRRLDSRLKIDFEENLQDNIRILGSLLAYHLILLDDEDRQRVFDHIMYICDESEFRDAMEDELAMLWRTQ